jgi:hypothetical protein
MDQHRLGEARQVEELPHRRAVLGEALLAFERALHRRLVVAQRQVAGQAVLAGAAVHREARDDVVAGSDVGHLVADGLHHAGRLVAEHDRRHPRVLALHEVQVAVAEPGGGGADEHLPRAGRPDLHLVDLELARDLPEHRGANLHLSP